MELWPAARASGKARPLMLRPAPVALACEMVVLVPPEFVTVTVWLCGLPTVTFPKATVAGETVSCPAEVPSPNTGKEALADIEEEPDEPEAELRVSEALPLTATLPLADPEDLGAKVTVKLVLCPAAKVTGKVRPLIVKAALLTEAFETVTSLPPEFLSVAVFASLWPTATVPKERDVGLACSAPRDTALPARVTAMVPAVAALVEIMSLPAGFPDACGVKATVRFALWPGARLKGIAGAIT